jgi:type VI secretion system protein ImpA
MASIDIEKLLEPISEEVPCGTNLEYDAEFLALERLAVGKPEQQMGDSIRAAEPPDFEVVANHAAALLLRSKDLRVAVLLARALSHLQGYKGLNEGTKLVYGLLARYFPTVYPQLDPEEGNDPTMRITAVAGLCAADILSALRVRPLIISRSFGPVSLRDFAVAAGNAAPAADGAKLDLAGVEAAFQEVDLAALETTASALKAISANLTGIEGIFDREASGQGPELGALVDIVRQAQHAVVSRLERRMGAAETAPGEASEASQAGAPRSGATWTGDIRTRADVLRALDKICEYYTEFEPSSPIPLLLQRGKRLISKNFLEIIRDMAPDGVSQVESIAGKADA